MKQIRVLMLGESLAKQGGIVSVQNLILEHTSSTLTIKHIATLVDGSKFKKTQAFIQAIIELMRELASGNVDLVHTHVSERGSAFRQAITTCVAALFRTPVIMHTHGSEFHVFYANLPWIARQGLSWAFRRCAHFIVLSEYWKQFYIQNLGLKLDRVTVLRNAVNVPAVVPQRGNSNPVSLIFLGRIGQRKGAFDLVKAFATLPESCRTRARLTLAGDGEGAQLRQLTERLGLTDHVSVIDWVNPELRDKLLSQSDVFILPSYNEGLPMALLEAMSWGLPVITTPVGGIPELIHAKENGLLVQSGDIEQLAAALQLLIDNTDLRLALGHAARQSVLPFDVKPYCDALVEIYHSVLARN